MDTITQALLGAACGNVCARHKLGKRAAVWGAIGGALPDLDTIAAIVGGAWAEMQHHRGVTHALWFGPVVGCAIGWLCWRRHAAKRARDASLDADGLGVPEAKRWWMLVVAVSMLSHPLLDIFTSYGTQIFAPFSNYRAGVNAIGIVDPVYSVPFIVALSLGKGDARRKVKASALALIFTTAYLFYGLWLNHRAERLAAGELERAGVSQPTVVAYPSVLQIFLRRVVARAGDDIYVGQVSMFAPRTIDWHRFREAEHALVARTRASAEGELFEWFAMKQTAARVEVQGDETIVEIHDLRYGDITEPELSMWGIRARYRDGTLVAPIERFRRGRSGGVGAALSRMMRDTFTPP